MPPHLPTQPPRPQCRNFHCAYYGAFEFQPSHFIRYIISLSTSQLDIPRAAGPLSSWAVLPAYDLPALSSRKASTSESTMAFHGAGPAPVRQAIKGVSMPGRDMTVTRLEDFSVEISGRPTGDRKVLTVTCVKPQSKGMYCCLNSLAAVISMTNVIHC